MITGSLIAAWFVFSVLGGLWHGERMHRVGFAAGRRREALDAQHARERIVMQSERIAHDAYFIAAAKGRQP